MAQFVRQRNTTTTTYTTASFPASIEIINFSSVSAINRELVSVKPLTSETEQQFWSRIFALYLEHLEKVGGAIIKDKSSLQVTVVSTPPNTIVNFPVFIDTFKRAFDNTSIQFLEAAVTRTATWSFVQVPTFTDVDNFNSEIKKIKLDLLNVTR